MEVLGLVVWWILEDLGQLPPQRPSCSPAQTTAPHPITGVIKDVSWCLGWGLEETWGL